MTWEIDIVQRNAGNNNASILARAIGTNPEDIGYSVAVDGDRMAVGSLGWVAALKAATLAQFIYMNTPALATIGSLKQKLTHKEPTQLSVLQQGDRFGASLALEGDYLAVGAPGDYNGFGAVYIFKRTTAGVWGFEQELSQGKEIRKTGPNKNLSLGL